MENGKENKTGYRVEQDSIGAKDIPGDVYYGVQSLRAAENFRITGLNMHPEIINSLAYIKKASAITNCESGILEKKKAKAIVQACDEILTGKLHEYFIVDPIQGGAGTSLNMNANEVIANRAIEILGGKKGDYSAVNPNDDVNCGQSTNDVIPTAGKMTSLRLLQNLKKELLRLHGALCKKAEEFDHVIKWDAPKCRMQFRSVWVRNFRHIPMPSCVISTVWIMRWTRCVPSTWVERQSEPESMQMKPM